MDNIKFPDDVTTPYGTYQLENLGDYVANIDLRPQSKLVMEYRQILIQEHPTILDDIKNFRKKGYVVKFEDYARDISLFSIYAPTFDSDGLKKWGTSRVDRKVIYKSLIDAIRTTEESELLQVAGILDGRNIQESPPERKISSFAQLKQYVLFSQLFGSIDLKQEQKKQIIQERISLPRPILPSPQLSKPNLVKEKALAQKSVKKPIACKISLLHEPDRVSVIRPSSRMKSARFNVEASLRRFGVFCGHNEYELDMVNALAPFDVKSKLLSLCEVRDYPALDFAPKLIR